MKWRWLEAAQNHLLNKRHKSRLALPFYQLCCEILIFAGAIFIDCYTIPIVAASAGGSGQPGLSAATAEWLVFGAADKRYSSGDKKETAMIPADKIRTKHKQWLSAVAAGQGSARKATTDAYSGCLAALKQIEANLCEMQYPVAQIITPCADVERAVKALRNGTSFTPPLLLAKFWREIGGVSFVDLNDYHHCEFWKKHGITSQYCDGLVVDGCSKEWVEYVVSDYTERKEDDYPFDESPFYFELSPDGYHKDNISGGAPYGLAPGGGWVLRWENFEWVASPASSHSPTDFLAYLRTAILECAGFPGLYGDPAFEPIRQHLLKDVSLF